VRGVRAARPARARARANSEFARAELGDKTGKMSAKKARAEEKY